MVVMNPLDATLDIVICEGGTVCRKFSDAEDSFSYLIGGSRANVGMTEGKAHFKVHILPSLYGPSTEDLQTTRALCIGVSWADVPVHKLGEVGCRRGDTVGCDTMQGSNTCLLRLAVTQLAQMQRSECMGAAAP